MAIHDLLWACPLCGRIDSLRRARDGEACAGCGTVFRRGRGSAIEARLPDGRTLSRAPAEWVEALPAEPPAELDPITLTGTGAEVAGALPGRSAVVLVRFSVGEQMIRRGGEYLGTMELLGKELRGTLTLTQDALRLDLERGDEHRWALDALSALQASSHTVQIRPRGQPIVSFEFPGSSARLWEESIAAALRHRWAALGRGDIVEFQPMIVGHRARPQAPRGAHP